MKAYARLTIDMYPDEHICLKMASAQLSISMREFVLLATFKKMIEEIDDEWLTKKAHEALLRFEEQKPIEITKNIKQNIEKKCS